MATGPRGFPENYAYQNDKKEAPKFMPDAEKEESLTDEQAKKLDVKLCIVCIDRAVRTVLIPCMHAKLCITCARAIGESNNKQCPECKQPIEKIVKVYM